MMNFFSRFLPPSAEAQEELARAQARQNEILGALRRNGVPAHTRERLEASRDGKAPWLATMTPAELLITRSHGIRPIATVSATCWLQYGFSWTEGHYQGWLTAVQRLREEALACGANAVLDVKMRTLPLHVDNSMDFTLIGTAVKIEGLPPSTDPIIATVPALEFVKLLEADVVPTGISVGAHYQWLTDWMGNASQSGMWGSAFWNVEAQQLSKLWETVRYRAHSDLRTHAAGQGNGLLAHINFSEMFEREVENQPKQYLARFIVIATIVDAKPGATFPHEIGIVVDMRDGGTPLTGTTPHHQSYALNDEDGAI
jgi:uncharacterized protein YbjQ (UPF0145 family)